MTTGTSVEATGPHLAPTGLYQVLIHEPLSVVEYLTVWSRFRRAFQVDAEELRSWKHDLLVVRNLPSRVTEAWEGKTGSRIKDYTGGATIGAFNEILYYLVRRLRPNTIVETGVAAGFSTAYLLQGLDSNGRGHLYSIDLPNTDPRGRVNADGQIARSFIVRPEETGFVVPADLRSRWTLTLGPSQIELPKLLETLGQVDMFWHDSEHSYENMMREYATVWPRLSVGCCLASDDIRWNRAFGEFSESVGQKPFRWIGGARGAVLKLTNQHPGNSPRAILS